MKTSVLALAMVCAGTVTVRAQVLDLRELNTEQIRRLDRAKTAIVIPGGILEEHGPYMPSYIDGYVNERQARELAEAIAARPGWTALLYPPIPLGQGGANVIGGKHSFPGSYNVRSETLRAVFMDLADAFGAQGFRHVLLVDVHGSPNHNRALSAAADYFNDTYGGAMVHLYGIMALRGGFAEISAPLLGEQGLKENGFSVHAGAGEHGAGLFLVPHLMSPSLAQAPPLTGGNFADLIRIARQDGWPGYFGAPARASAALGAQQYRAETTRLIETGLRVLDGWNPRGEARYADLMDGDPGVKGVDEAADAEDAKAAARQKAWIEKNRKAAR